MGLFGFVLTIVAGAAGGWWLKGKVDKKPTYKSSSSTIDDEEL